MVEIHPTIHELAQRCTLRLGLGCYHQTMKTLRTFHKLAPQKLSTSILHFGLPNIKGLNIPMHLQSTDYIKGK